MYLYVYLSVYKSFPQSLVSDLRGKTLFVINLATFPYFFKVIKERSLMLKSL